MKKIATAGDAELRGRGEWGNRPRAGAKRQRFSGPHEATPLPNGGDIAGLVAPKTRLVAVPTSWSVSLSLSARRDRKQIRAPTSWSNPAAARSRRR
jgi:hypothetical protein